MDRIEFMQSQNFEHLRKHWPELANLGGHAEIYALDDPQSALIKLRCFAELLVGVIYREYRLVSLPNDKFLDRLDNATFKSMVDMAILDKLHALRKEGNKAAHEGNVNKSSALWLLKEAHILGCWLLLATKKGSKADFKPFAEIKTQYSTKSLQEKLAEHEARLAQALKELDAAQEAEQKAQLEITKLAKINKESGAVAAAQFKQDSDKAKNLLDLNEEETRRRLIDIELHARGWNVDLINPEGNTDEVTREKWVDGQPTQTGTGRCDYVLWDDDQKPLAVIEAKRTRRDAKEGREQAKLYADALEKKYGQRPVIFYTNGYDIYIWDDVQRYAPRKIYGFYGKNSLQYLVRQRSRRADLNKTPIDVKVAGRDYQIETITRVCERFELLHRKALVVQATGTGKTRVAIALSKRMIEAGWAKRILFLCDRKELRKQAGKAFNEFTSEPLYIVGKSKKEDKANARIYVSTYPGMLGLMEEFDPGYFDLIIADESHRSIYNVYGDIFKYFDALQLGLTATPVEMVSRSTCQLFGCDYKLPTANYPLEQAVAEHNLVPFKVVTHTTEFLRDGIQGKSLSDEQIAELEDQGIDPNDLEFDSKQIDKAVFNKDTNRIILRNLMEKGLRMADGQTIGKSIMFARSIDHAELLAELFTEMYPEYGGNFCRVIHSKYERAEEIIDAFKSTTGGDDQVTVAISVDMLDTGIDVPEILNLVFAKPVKSKVKFWQMIGRGTRLCENLFDTPVENSRDKTKFLIFDHWGNFAYHELPHDDEEPRNAKSLSQKLFESRLVFAEEALRQGVLDSFNKMMVLIKQDIDSLDNNCIAIKDNWKLKQQLSDLKTLQQFAPATKVALYEYMAPLMQWRNILGQGEALRFDLDIVNAQYAKLCLQRTSASQHQDLLELTKMQVQEKVRKLSMHLNQLRQKADSVNRIQQDKFWKEASFDDFEIVREDLRPVIHLRDKGGAPPEVQALIYDITENKAKIEINDRPANILTVDFEIYRQEVEKTLTPLFEKNPVLQKIRAGIPVTDKELDVLNALLHTQNANVNLEMLREFYPESSVGLDELLRTIIGLDAEAVEKRFTAFIQEHHINLSALQQRFMGLLKSVICKRGQITIADLYDQPFKSLHDNGIDGLFKDEQADLLAKFIGSFEIKLGDQHHPVIRKPEVKPEHVN